MKKLSTISTGTGYQIPSLRAHRTATAVVMPAPQPLAAPALVATTREAVCEAACNKGPADRCQLFGCCPKTISETANMALQQCPAGHWKRWLPTK